MATLIRQPRVGLIWAGRDVSDDLAPYLQELTFTDTLKSGSRDEVSLILDNSDGRFGENWWPTAGDELLPEIQWRDETGQHKWRLGTFSIDKIKLRLSPKTLTISALSQTLNRTVLEKVGNQAWEGVDLGQVVAELAKQAGLRSIIEVNSGTLERLDRSNESPHQFLTRMAIRFNAHYAVKGETLLFSEAPEAGDLTLDLMNNDLIIGGELSLSSRNSYASASMDYYHGDQKKLMSHHEGATGGASSQELVVNGIARSKAEARTLCQQALKEANKQQGGEGNLQLVGEPISAGAQLTLINAGKMSGAWKSNNAIHTVRPKQGWTTRLKVESDANRSE